MSQLKVLVTDSYTTESLAKLRAHTGAEVFHSKGKFPSKEELEGVEVLLIRSRTEVSQKLLDRAPDLKLVVTSTSGFDHIDLNLCLKKDVKAFYTPEANAVCAAEVTMMLMLNMSRHMSQCQKAIRQHQWKDQVPKSFELRGKNLGIIGLGRVGSEVAKLAKAFGMEVAAHDPYVRDNRFNDLGVERLGLTELFYQSSILSFHVPLTKETYRIVNRATIETMTPGICIVNASRGGIIEETELIEALESGHIKAAALDVFESEPLAQSSRFRKLPNVVVSPHIGGYSEEAFERASMQAVDLVIDYLKGDPVQNQLPPEADWYL